MCNCESMLIAIFLKFCTMFNLWATAILPMQVLFWPMKLLDFISILRIQCFNGSFKFVAIGFDGFGFHVIILGRFVNFFQY
jgi:hypothetical protein